jgi:hypothetical protein
MAAEQSRARTDEGYKAWLEKKQAKAGKAASEARNAHLQKARASRMPKRLVELPATELSEG